MEDEKIKVELTEEELDELLGDLPHISQELGRDAGKDGQK